MFPVRPKDMDAIMGSKKTLICHMQAFVHGMVLDQVISSNTQTKAFKGTLKRLKSRYKPNSVPVPSWDTSKGSGTPVETIISASF